MKLASIRTNAVRFGILCIAISLPGRMTIALDIIVDPQAAPNQSRSIDAPFHSIDTALDAVAHVRQTRLDLAEPLRIVLTAGDYLVLESITLTAAHSGTPNSPTVLVGSADDRSRLLGGVEFNDSNGRTVEDPAILRRLSLRTPDSNIKVVDLAAILSEEALAMISGPVHRGMGTPVRPIATEVFWNGEALTLARWPNEGFATVSKVIDTGSIPRNRAEDIPIDQRETGPERGGVFEFDDPKRLERWASAPDAWAFGYWHWDWADEQLPIESIHPETKQIALGLPHRYGLRNAAKFYITNLLEELDAPGEYYIDRESKRLYFRSPDSSDDEPRELMITLAPGPLLRIENASHIAIDNLVFEGTRGPAIEARDVEQVTIANCVIRNIGTYGIMIDGTNNQIANNTIHGIGATAISVTGGDRATLTSASNEIVNNHIHDFGRVYRTYQPAVRLAGVGQRVANNRIHDAPHSAIMFGGNDHLIERNEIFNVLLETGDCGAIYCGRDWTLHGTVIRHNFFHHLSGSDNRYQNAVYLDDMASGIHVIGNIFYDCHWGMLVGGGRHNHIRGNIFFGGKKAISFDARGVGWMAKHIADPSTSTLHKNLAAVPYMQPPWSTRFPELQEYLTDRFGRPVGSAFVDNAIYNTELGRIDDRKCVRVEGNVVGEAPADMFFVDPDAEAGAIEFVADEWLCAKAEDLGAIPLHLIGLERD